MLLQTLARSALAIVLGLASWLAAQAPEAPGSAASRPKPDPKQLLARCLEAHRGTYTGLPRNLYFVGDVQQRSAKGDVNEADVWQWYAREPRDGGKPREQMVTRMIAKGTENVSLRMFDGKRHYVVTRGVRVRVDLNASYKVDLANIKRDLALTRFLIRHFLAGTALRADAKFTYLGRESLGKVDCHKIGRTTPDKVTTIYYVVADPEKRPFLRGIEFPATGDQPRRLHTFGSVRKFGPFHVPQEIEITEPGPDGTRDRSGSVVSIWITQFRIDEARRPAWADITRYPRKRTPKPKPGG
jgi:hypothetical protein